MFSVDNFYNVFNSHHGFHQTGNITLTFRPHGAKEFYNLEPYGLDQDLPEYRQYHATSGRFIMHDQEPFSLNYVNTYKNNVQDLKILSNMSASQQAKIHSYKTWYPYATPIELIHLTARGVKTPIFCHSELNSLDINELESNNFITCYYWWHGMIARDWFRHWEHYKELEIQNKADTEYRFLMYSREFTGTREYRKQVIDHLKKFQSCVLYNWDSSQVASDYSAKISLEDSNRSAIHIVAETLFDTEKIYLTEKVFKPMVMSQPFILFAAPRSLQYLRNYGFKTFDECWDESYDNEKNSTIRMAKILSLIDSLNNMSLPEFKKLYEKLLPIIEHNRKRFFSNEFQKFLINEMDQNIKIALEKQKENVNKFPIGTWLPHAINVIEKCPAVLKHWAPFIDDLSKYNPDTVNSYLKRINAMRIA